VIRILLIVLVCTGAVLGPRAALAQPDPGDRVRARLDRGQELFGELEYRKAIEILAPVPEDPAATRAQRLRALEVIGLSHLILGEEDGARRAFERLLAIDPGYQLRDDTGSPKIRDFFDQVKRAYVPGFAGSAELEHSAPEGAAAGRPIELEVNITEGDDQVGAVTAHWRRRGVLDYRREPMRRVDGRRWRGRFQLPASPNRYALEYYIEARDAGGGPVGRVAGPETPLSIPVAPGAGDQPSPWYRRWYTVAGVAVLGVATVVVFATADSAPDGSLGNVTLSP
jgi:hypothetical protein